MAHWYHSHTVLSIRHPQQAYVITFTAYLPGGSSVVYPLCLLVVYILLFLEQSLTSPRQPSTLNARIWREIKSINPLPGLVNLSHTVHHSLWPCNLSSLALFNPLAFCLDGCGYNLPNPCGFSPASAETAKSLLQGHVYTHLIVRCSLAYNESHRTAQMSLKGFRMQGSIVKIILGYNQKVGEKWIPQHMTAFQHIPSMCIWKVLLLLLTQIRVCGSLALFSH